MEALSRTAGKYLKLAELPEAIVKMVASPTAISLRAGLIFRRLSRHWGRRKKAVAEGLPNCRGSMTAPPCSNHEGSGA